MKKTPRRPIEEAANSIRSQGGSNKSCLLQAFDKFNYLLLAQFERLN